VGVQAPDRATWRVFGVLMAAALIGVVGILPYAFTLLDRLPGSIASTLPPLWLLLPVQVVQSMVLLAAATALGLWLGPKVGLGAPMLYGLLSADREARSRLRALLLPSAVLGLLTGVAIALLDLWVFGPRLAAAGSGTGALHPPAWQGLLASFYGAIPEELLLRLGLMTLLVWIGARLTRTSVPRPAVVWTAIVLAALLFGVGHLPTTAAVLPLTPLVVARALVLNGLGGITFGWLYWKRGLLAAMLAHFSADLVLHVAVPLLTT
jgi:membrane protease YdiL (CAAX protease family)